MDHIAFSGNPSSAVLTIPELAALLGLNPKATYALAKQGRLPKPIAARRIGRRWVVSKASVRRFLDGDDDEE